MKITQDVIKDLLTVYLAGEATADTRSLVEEWLRTDPELARHVNQARKADLPGVAALPPTLEKRALDRTRRQLRWRAVLLGTAIFASMLPLSVSFSSEGFNGLVIDNWPERLVVISLATALWAIYWRMSRRMRVSGL